MNRTPPATCQFVSAVCSAEASSVAPRCDEPARWPVWTLGEPSACVGWVCSGHAAEVVRLKIGRVEKAKLNQSTDAATCPQTKCPNDTDGDGDCHLCHNKGGCPNR